MVSYDSPFSPSCRRSSFVSDETAIVVGIVYTSYIFYNKYISYNAGRSTTGYLRGVYCVQTNPRLHCKPFE